MTQHFVPSRGAAPVGQMHELPPVERLAVLFLRAWCEGGMERDQVSEDFRRALGPIEGDQLFEDFDALLRLMVHRARCPLMRHGMSCRCFGGHESAFAQLIAAAATQDRDEALLFATTLMPGPSAWQAVQLATNLGPAMLQIARGLPEYETMPKQMIESRHLH